MRAHMSTLFQAPFPGRPLHDITQSALCSAVGPYQPPILHAVGACHALHMRMCGSACFHCVLYVTCAVCYAHCTPSVLICHSSQTLVVSCSLPGGGPQAAAYCALPDAEIPLPPTLPAKVLSQAHRSGPRGPPAPSLGSTRPTASPRSAFVDQ